MINGIMMKGKRIIIPFQLQKKILWQLHSNHMGIKKKRLLACISVFWFNMNTDIENTVKQCSVCLDYQITQLQNS